MGLIVALVFYTILLKTQPFEDDDDDKIEAIATASTVMTLLIGFALKATEKRATRSEEVTGDEEYDAAMLDGLLVLLFVAVAISGTYITYSAVPNPFAMCSAAKQDINDKRAERNNKKLVKKLG